MADRVTNLFQFAWNFPCFSTESPESHDNLHGPENRVVGHPNGQFQAPNMTSLNIPTEQEREVYVVQAL